MKVLLKTKTGYRRYNVRTSNLRKRYVRFLAPRASGRKWAYRRRVRKHLRKLIPSVQEIPKLYRFQRVLNWSEEHGKDYPTSVDVRLLYTSAVEVDAETKGKLERSFRLVIKKFLHGMKFIGREVDGTEDNVRISLGESGRLEYCEKFVIIRKRGQSEFRYETDAIDRAMRGFGFQIGKKGFYQWVPKEFKG